MNMIELIFSQIHSIVVQKMCNTILAYYIKDVLGMPNAHAMLALWAAHTLGFCLI